MHYLKTQETFTEEKLTTKGKPWTVDEETTLKALVEANTPIEKIAAKLNKKPAAIYVKCHRLGITQKQYSITSNIPLPKDLPSVEETLRKVAGALDLACIPGLDKDEIQRLQIVATLSKVYQVGLANYIDYRNVEFKVNDMEAKYEALLQERANMARGKNDEAKPVPTEVGKAPEKPAADQPREP